MFLGQKLLGNFYCRARDVMAASWQLIDGACARTERTDGLRPRFMRSGAANRLELEDGLGPHRHTNQHYCLSPELLHCMKNSRYNLCNLISIVPGALCALATYSYGIYVGLICFSECTINTHSDAAACDQIEQNVCPRHTTTAKTPPPSPPPPRNI